MASSSYTDAILLFGDSITQSWEPGSFAQRMAEWYNRTCDVIVRGYSGYTAEWAIPVFEQIFATNAARKAGQAQNVKLMTIWFGANDAVRPGPAHYQHVPIPNYKAFLSKLISLVRSPTSAYYSPETKILLITPSPVADGLDYANSRRTWMGNEQIHGPIQPVHLNAVTKEYAKACVDVAEAEGVTVIDMHSAITEAAGGCSDEKLKAFVPDGLHLSSQGYEVLHNKLTELIKTNFPELDPWDMEIRVPSYKVFQEGTQIGLAKLAENGKKRAAETDLMKRRT